MAPPAAHLTTLLISAAVLGGAAVRQTEIITSEEEKIPPKVYTIVRNADSPAKLQTTLNFAHKHSFCNLPCGMGVGDHALTNSMCMDLTEDACRSDPSLVEGGKDEGSGKNVCMYSCSVTYIMSGAMCCSYQGQTAWVPYEELYEKGKCPVAFAEADQEKCGEQISEYKKGPRLDYIHLLRKPWTMSEHCNGECGKSVGESPDAYMPQLRMCTYYAKVETCPGGSAVHEDAGIDHLGFRACAYECDGGSVQLPMGSICCESGWVSPERQQLDSTGSAVCPDGFSDACNDASPVL